MSSHRHFILHKPFGYISQFVAHETKRRNKKLLGALYDFPEGIMAIGRLDKKSEGLLFLTTDGKVSEHIRSKHVEKEYLVEVSGNISYEAILQLEGGIEIGTNELKYTTLPCIVKKHESTPELICFEPKTRDPKHGPTSWISITIRQGKFRQVRRMTAAVGFPTVRLLRIRIGQIEIKNLKAGQVTEVEDFGKMNV